MPSVQERTFFPLEIIHEGWVRAFGDWALWVNDPAGHANDTKAGLVQNFLFLEGLRSPLRPITSNEATCLQNIVDYFETYSKASSAMRKKLIANDAQIVTDMGIQDYRPGWEYLRDALDIDVRPPTLSALNSQKLSSLDSVQSVQDIGNEIHNGNYDIVILPPADRTFNEYETAESALISDPSASPVTGTPGTDPPVVDPAEDPSEGE
jgi:hypothetical protein